MDNKGLISVIVPVYNVEKYLHECIDSVLRQTYTNFELILVDDGSKDSSKYICEEYARKDSRIKVLEKENGGASSARNLGMAVAEGEYIYFLDSDDWLSEQIFELLVLCSGSEKVDIVFFDAYTVEQETGKVATNNYFHKYKYNPKKGYILMGEMLKNREFRVSPCLLFFKTEFLQKSNIRFEEGIMYEDMIFAYQVFYQAEKVAYLPEFLYYRRYRENSVMTAKKSMRNFISAERVYYKVREYAENNKLIEDEITKLYMVRCSLNVLNLYKRMSAEERKKSKENYIRLKKDILEQHSYGDKALQMRCYGKIFWFMYKLYEKVLLKGTKR